MNRSIIPPWLKPFLLSFSFSVLFNLLPFSWLEYLYHLNLADYPGRSCQLTRSQYGWGEWSCEGDSELKFVHGMKLTSNRLIFCSPMLSPHCHRVRTEMPAIRTISHPREPPVPMRVVPGNVARLPQDAVVRAECPVWLPALLSRSVRRVGSP